MCDDQRNRRQITLDPSERRVMNRRKMLQSTGAFIGASAMSASAIGASTIKASPAAAPVHRALARLPHRRWRASLENSVQEA